MILRITALLPLLLSSVASAIEVSMIDMEDILENHRVVTDPSDSNTSASRPGNKGTRGISLVTTKLRKLLTKTPDDDIGASFMDPSEWHEAQTTFLSSTTYYHRDTNRDEKMGPFEVGFVFLNTNNDAYFEYPGVSIPIKEGAFVRFIGSNPHRTVVNKGIVHLLGPFDTKSFDKVEGPPYCCDGNGGCAYPTIWVMGGTDEDACIASDLTYGGNDCSLGCKSSKSSKSPTTKAPKNIFAKSTKSPKA